MSCAQMQNSMQKIDGALQELRETFYWIELVTELKYVDERRVTLLLKEAEEIKAMLIASSRTVKLRRQPTNIRAD